MSELTPDGTEPIGVWDTTDHGGTWWSGGMVGVEERIKWAKANISRPNDTVRVDFYLLDAPFMVAYRVKRSPDGKICPDPETGRILEEPALEPLAGLPPAHLLADFDACPLPDHGGHRRAVPRQPVDRPQVGRRRPLGAHQRQPVPLPRRRRPGVLRPPPRRAYHAAPGEPVRNRCQRYLNGA